MAFAWESKRALISTSKMKKCGHKKRFQLKCSLRMVSFHSATDREAAKNAFFNKQSGQSKVICISSGIQMFPCDGKRRRQIRVLSSGSQTEMHTRSL